MNNKKINISQEIQKLVTILFTELDVDSIIKLKNNKEFMNCISILKNYNKILEEDLELVNAEIVKVVNNEFIPNGNKKRIINVEAYEKHCEKIL